MNGLRALNSVNPHLDMQTFNVRFALSSKRNYFNTIFHAVMNEQELNTIISFLCESPLVLLCIVSAVFKNIYFLIELCVLCHDVCV